MKVLKFDKKVFNNNHIVCAFITIALILCSIFFFPNALGRLIESFRDFGISIAYYFCKLFDLNINIVPTVNDLPKLPFFDTIQMPIWSVFPTTSLSESWLLYKANFVKYWYIWAEMANFKGYIGVLGGSAYIISQILLIIVPFAVFIGILMKRYCKKENNNYNIDSKPLKTYKKCIKLFVLPFKQRLTLLGGFVKEHKVYRLIWLALALLSFNIVTIIVEFFAFYFYFVISFDTVSLYPQFYKLALDMYVFTLIPWYIWLGVALVAFERFRKKIGYARLNHFENKNCGFINERPIVLMVCGTMGKKKTTAITDMALSQEVMFRDKAFEKILENDLKFPFFPWINFENCLKHAMSTHSVYNLATCSRFVQSKQKKFLKKQLKYRCFGYDFKRYGVTFDDKLKVVNLWEVLEIYAKLYFIYVIQSSLLISNFSIRTDCLIKDVGNFPIWNSNFFNRDSRLIDSFSKHAHILDFDNLRLGKKLVENNVSSDGFEFGVLTITEIGKERKNTLELRETKRNEDVTNQKNDGFNDWLKMVRHSATVDNFPFVRVIADEQRPSSWGADARDLCEIVHIKESGDTKLAMPFFFIAELLHGWFFGKFTKLYYKYRYVRSDNTLFMYALKGIVSKMHSYYTKVYNTFSYCELTVQIESGTQDGEIKDKKYYLMSKKIYSKRFSTDCFSDFFKIKALRSSVGLNDVKEYQTEKASFAELEKQNSYFINDLLRGFNKKE